MDTFRNIFCQGKRVYLRAPTRADAEGAWHSWMNDEDTAKYLNQWRPNTVERQLEFFETRVKASGDLILAVVDMETDRHIGITSISKIDWVHRFADLAIVIGDPKARETGILGFEAFALTVRTAFLRLNLENVKGGYIAGQAHSESILKAMRFREVGRIKNLFTIDGVKQDQVLVQLSRSDWMSRNKAVVA